MYRIRLKRRGAITVLLIALVIAFVLAMPFFLSDYFLSFLISLFMFVALSESWSIFSGNTGYISLAVVAFFGTGMYTTAILGSVLPPVITVLLGALLAAVFAVVLGFPALRVRGPYFIILTFGLAQLVQQLVQYYETTVTGRVSRLILVNLSTPFIYYELLAIAIVTVLTNYLIRRSKFGLGLLSIQQDEDAARVIGVRTTRLKLTAFALSALFMGAVGAVVAFRWQYMYPAIVFDPLITFQVIIMALLGGATNAIGPILGTVLVLVLSEVLGSNYPYHYLILLGVILIIIVLFARTGLVGLLRSRSLTRADA